MVDSRPSATGLDVTRESQTSITSLFGGDENEELQNRRSTGADNPSNVTVHTRSQESILREFVGIRRPQEEAAEHMSSKVMLHHLYGMLPVQLTPSYRSTAEVPPDSSAENNIRIMKELYPSQQHLHRVRAAGFVVEAVHHLRKIQCNYVR